MNKNIETFVIDILVKSGFNETDALYDYYHATASLVDDYAKLTKNYTKESLDSFVSKLISHSYDPKRNQSASAVFAVLQKNGLDEQTSLAILRKGEEEHLRRLIEHLTEDL